MSRPGDLFTRLDAAFAGQADLLTPRQLEIIRAWQRTDRFYEFAQRVARSAIDLDRLPETGLAEVLDIQQALDDAIETVRLPFPLRVYRGVRDVKRTLLVESPAEAVGQISREDGYLATSVVREVAVREFTSPEGALFEIDVPAGVSALWVAGVGLGPLRRQGELLLSAGRRSSIYAYRRLGSLAVLSMEVLADE